MLEIGSFGHENHIENVIARRRSYSLTTDDSAIQITNVDFSGSWCGLGVWNVNGLVLRGPLGTGMDAVSGYGVALHNVRNSVISDIDVSWSGEGNQGTGIVEQDGSTNNQIVDVNAANRNVALEIVGDSQDPDRRNKRQSQLLRFAAVQPG